MTMLLKSQDGSEFELGLIEDRLPDIQDGIGDATALTVTFRVASADESWEETSPCLNTFEFANLAEWLEAVAEPPSERDQGEVAELDLLEPELNFQVIRDEGDEVVLRVGFHLEDRPEEFDVDTPTDEAEHVDLRVTREHLRIAASQLRSDLESIGRATSGEPGIAGDQGTALKDDLLGEGELGEVRPPTDDLGLSPREVDEDDVGFGTGLDEGEEAIMRELVREDEEEEEDEREG